MEPTLEARLAALETKTDAIYASLEKIRTYFKWAVIISLLLFVLPLIGVLFAIPSFIDSYTTNLEALTQ